MRATEYLNAGSNGIGNTELYSHLDVAHPLERWRIKIKRKEIRMNLRKLKKQACSTQDK